MMTASDWSMTTADKLAADEIIEKYKLAVWHAETWVCSGLMRSGADH